MKTNEMGEKQTVFPLGIRSRINGVDGCMSVIVKSKTSLENPVNETKTYWTVNDNQTEMTIAVGLGRR